MWLCVKFKYIKTKLILYLKYILDNEIMVKDPLVEIQIFVSVMENVWYDAAGFIIPQSYLRLWYESYSFIIPDIFQKTDESLDFSDRILLGINITSDS